MLDYYDCGAGILDDYYSYEDGCTIRELLKAGIDFSAFGKCSTDEFTEEEAMELIKKRLDEKIKIGKKEIRIKGLFLIENF